MSRRHELARAAAYINGRPIPSKHAAAKRERAKAKRRKAR